MSLQARPLRAVVCDPDLLNQAALAHAAEQAGFEVVDRVENGPRALSSVERLAPSLLLLANELSGMLGEEVIRVLRGPEPHLHNAEPEVEIVLVGTDPSIRDRAMADGASAVVPRGNVDALERVLAEIRIYLETGERRTSADRRVGDDRRLSQDWGKVISERRRGDDRRNTGRRDGEGFGALNDLADS